MATPSGVTIVARTPDGTETDVTEGVQVLYDGVIQSLDWGSGFWSREEAVPVAEIARVCGFERDDEAERYLRERDREDYRRNRYSELIREGVDRTEAFGRSVDEAKAKYPDPT